MVSAPSQPVAIGNALVTRFDANIRPYWLRDWQSGFGGYTKVYEYQRGGQTKRMYSVAHVVRPRILSDGCNAKLQAMEETRRPEVSIKKYSIGSQTISELAVAGHSTGSGERCCEGSYRRLTSAMLASGKVEHPKVDIQDIAQGDELSNLWKDTRMGYEASEDDLSCVC